MSDVQPLLQVIDQQIDLVEQAYKVHTGNQTACQLHKDGRVTGGLKYDEGRLVALMDLRRSVRKAELIGDSNLASTIEAEIDRWRRDLHRYQTAQRPSLSWIAYSQGGVDALQAIRDRLPNLP